MPITIGSVSIADVNIHLGASSTAQRSMNDVTSRNVGAKVGSGNPISFRDLRFGINFPAGDSITGTGGSNMKDANETSEVYLWNDIYDFGWSPGDAGMSFGFSNDGSGDYSGWTFGPFTWLSSGMIASEHYLRWEAVGDTGFLSGSPINIDLQMNTNRFWELTVPGPTGPGGTAGQVGGDLVVKDSDGTEYFRRTFTLRGDANWL